MPRSNGFCAAAAVSIIMDNRRVAHFMFQRGCGLRQIRKSRIRPKKKAAALSGGAFRRLGKRSPIEFGDRREAIPINKNAPREVPFCFDIVEFLGFLVDKSVVFGED